MSAPSGKIIQFTPQATATVEVHSPSVRTSLEYISAKVGETTAVQLYPLAQEINPELYTALTLLDDGLKLISSARLHFLEGNVIAADDCAQKLRALLRDLFCFVSLGDTFRSVVLATFHALVNLRGNVITQDQTVRMKEALEIIRRSPFASFDDALEIQEKYEEAGMNPYPSDIDDLTDILVAENEEHAPDVGVGY